METKNTQERMLNLAHDLLNEVEQMVSKNKLNEDTIKKLRADNYELTLKNETLHKQLSDAQQKVDEAKSLADWEKHLKEEAECTVHAQAEQLVSGATRSNTWHTIDDDKRPLDGEQVLVATSNGTKYLQTYLSECGFIGEIVYWMTIPEIN